MHVKYVLALPLIFTLASSTTLSRSSLEFLNAARSGSTELVESILKTSQITPEDSGRALQAAASRGKDPVVALLLDQKHAPILPGYDIGAVLSTAALNGYLPVIKLLLKRQDLFVSPEHAGDALRNAAENGHMLIASLLLEQKHLQITAKDINEAFELADRNEHTPIGALLKTHQNSQSVCIVC